MNFDRRLLEFARQMRHERLMWKLLRNRRLAGFRYRRQEPIPPYIADFYCAVAKLVIELDGDSHADPASIENDRTRQCFLESLGLTVLRFWNAQLFEDQESVVEAIYNASRAGVESNEKVSSNLDEWGWFLGPGERENHEGLS